MDEAEPDPDTGTGGDGAEPGRRAEGPTDVPGGGWIEVAKRVKDEIKADNVVLLAAGVAFFALTALVPALVAVVSIYGLIADPADVQRQVADLAAAMPADARDLLTAQLESITESSSSGLGLAVAASVAIALWSASSGMKHLMTSINAAYDENPDERGFVVLRGTSLLLTLGAVVFFVVTVALVAVLPAALADTALGGPARVALNLVRWPLLFAGLLAGLAVLYRIGADRDDPEWRWTSPGALVAAVLWIVASIAFSFYTANFGSYNETYGSMGAVIVLMLWLFLTVLMVLLGAEVNAELERQTARDTTVGEPEPMGERGAVVADMLPGEESR